MDYTSLESYVRTTLSEKRWQHSKSTALQAVALAQRFGAPRIVGEQAMVAGLWHDVAREWSTDSLFSYVKEYAIPLEVVEMYGPILLHGPVAASLLRLKFPEWASTPVLDAIRWHTLGSVSMGPLGAIIYIADYMEPERTHLDNEQRRMLLDCGSLELMTLSVVKAIHVHLLGTGKEVATVSGNLEKFLASGGSLGQWTE